MYNSPEHEDGLNDSVRQEQNRRSEKQDDFAQQAQKLSHEPADGHGASPNVATKAQFITPHDAVIVTARGERLPGVPLREAHKLNVLREEAQGEPERVEIREGGQTKEHISNVANGEAAPQKVIQLPKTQNGMALQKSNGQTLERVMPPSHTNPLFPPLPLYGPPSKLRDLQCASFRVSAFFLSLAFLMSIVMGSLVTSLWGHCAGGVRRLTGRSPAKERPFREEEQRRAQIRKVEEETWSRSRKEPRCHGGPDEEAFAGEEFVPTEGGKDPIVCDVGYYARRVGLDVEEFHVQTEDGFIIDLWHVYDPREYKRLDEGSRAHHGPNLGGDPSQRRRSRQSGPKQPPKFPVLMIHGLLQSSGAYCCNDDSSLAFWLCKAGYDVWLGNNRCGFQPKHTLLEYNDPRMWCWNIRQMGVFDLPAMTDRVISETGFEKIGLICHSQGTTQTLVALAKEQRPELGERLSVFCALAPAAYAGPLIGKMYFKFMRIISPAMFRLMFGIHAFIPFMMQMHSVLSPKLYGWLGYKVFSFLFDWSDVRWDRGLRDRMFQFAPVYVSAESMRWWLGRECFAKHKCILATKEDLKAEMNEDDEGEAKYDTIMGQSNPSPVQSSDSSNIQSSQASQQQIIQPKVTNSDSRPRSKRRQPKGSTAWYNSQAPPMALWVCGNDDLVDGGRLLRRLESGREPHVRVVHSKTIPEYEHLDVIWAMDAPEQVFKEVAEVLWKTCPAREACRVPRGCEGVQAWQGNVGGIVNEDSFQTSSGSGSGSEAN